MSSTVHERMPGLLPFALAITMLAVPELPIAAGRVVWKYETGG